MKAVVDRIEGSLVVLEIDGNEVVFPLKLLPKGIIPGNILDISISLNPAEEKKQRDKIKKLQERLKGNN